MSRILFVSYEFHPTTWGGCGVLLRHATDLLLSQGHEVELLLDIPKSYFDRFLEIDLPKLSVPMRCRAHRADDLCDDFPWSPSEVSNPFVWKSLRFAHALRRLSEADPVDFVEFFEYCGVGYHALVEKRFGLQPPRPVVGMRVHNSVELIDLHEGTKPVDRDRAILYGLERAGLAHSETTLLPSRSYFERYYRERYSIPEDAIEISEPPTVGFPRRPDLPLEERREIQFFGRIFEFKGVDRFVRAALLLLEARPSLDMDFVLIGNDSHDGPGGGSYAEYLMGSIPKQFRDRFVCAGHLDHDTVVGRFGSARFAVFPNQFESFCYAAHEVYAAGVPMLVSDIPAFRNYFEEDLNAFYFDGSSLDLARQMTRLLDEPALLAGLDCGGRLPTDPLGSFYEAPHALRPIGLDRPAAIGIAVVVLVPERATEDHLRRTLDAIRPQLESRDTVALAFQEGDPRASGDATSMRWLGSIRRFQDEAGDALALSDLRTQDALWVLLAGDEPAPDFVGLCRGALSRNPSLGFAGSWMRDSAGALVDGPIDVVPERYPFDAGARLTRALLRTRPGALLVEVFRAQAGVYGEIGALWEAEEEWGRGCLLPRTLIRTSPVEMHNEDASQLAFLVQSVASPNRRERLSLLTLEGAVEHRDAESASGDAPRRTVPEFDQVQQLAREYLDGKTLAQMAGRKFRRKLTKMLSRRENGRAGRRGR